MRIWRVETIMGEGPYFSNLPPADVIPIANRKNNPEPFDDNIATVPRNYIFGFTSLDDLWRWFSKDDFAVTRGKGWKIFISEYEIHPRYTKAGGKQIAFNKKMAKRINRAIFWGQ